MNGFLMAYLPIDGTDDVASDYNGDRIVLQNMLCNGLDAYWLS